jgi:transposase-like protein
MGRGNSDNALTEGESSDDSNPLLNGRQISHDINESARKIIEDKTLGRKEKALALRSEEGMSIKKIAKAIGAATSTISVWVRDIKLSDVQKVALHKAMSDSSVVGSRANREIHLAKRRSYQEEGRAKAREGNLTHQAGCMLYWGEGGKSRNKVSFCNADAQMLKIFIEFLREHFSVLDEQITIYYAYYPEPIYSEEEVEAYWSEMLNISTSRLRPQHVPVREKGKIPREHKLPYGTLSLNVGSTKIVQHIFGAIQEYSGITKEEWLG